LPKYANETYNTAEIRDRSDYTSVSCFTYISLMSVHSN